MNVEPDANTQIIHHMQAACEVWNTMSGEQGLRSLMAAALSLCEMVIEDSNAGGMYLFTEVARMIAERAPAQPGDTIQ